MNRLVLIGNGFDLAHKLKTSYADFIDWYWDKRANDICCVYAKEYSDDLISVKYKGEGYIYTYFYGYLNPNFHEESGYGKDVINEIVNSPYFETTFSPLLERICKGVRNKYWAGIEGDYYDILKQYAIKENSPKQVEELNLQLMSLQKLLVEYLLEIEKQEVTINQHIWNEIYAPINSIDIATASKKYWVMHMVRGSNLRKDDLRAIKNKYRILTNSCLTEVENFDKKHSRNFDWDNSPVLWRLPHKIMLVNFNYTSTPEKYLNKDVAELVYIHGKLDNLDSVIFGYGDEIDSSFKKLQDLNYSECMRHIKSMRYPQASNYKKVLDFIESEPFQVYVMGHSCGLSDRTLLSKIFKHKLCASIKPYFYIKKEGVDNYDELIPSISRHVPKMADRVVNRDRCTTIEGII